MAEVHLIHERAAAAAPLELPLTQAALGRTTSP